jgi:phytanoyl-CoA hydroxylase
MWFDQARDFVGRQANHADDPFFQDFLRKGYAVLPSAVDAGAIDNYMAAVKRKLGERDPRLVAIYPNQMTSVAAAEADFTQSSVRLLDSYTAIPESHDLLFSETLVAALHKLFGRPATCFQSLHFFVGSEQAVHQDTAYVVIKDDPLAFVGIWIALEDIEEGTGELCYYEGSHLIPPFEYGKGRLHFNHEIDSNETHAEHLNYLHVRSKLAGLPLVRHRPRKGDALVWHSLLAHGGSPRNRPGSRLSLVGHYTPIGMTPHYFGFLPPDRQRYFRDRNERGWFASFNSPHQG